MVLAYSLACLFFFIFVTYLEYCLLMLPSKVLRKLACRVSCKMPCSSPCKKKLEMADKVFFVFWFLAFMVFSVISWFGHPSFPPPTQCYNEEHARVDCSNPAD